MTRVCIFLAELHCIWNSVSSVTTEFCCIQNLHLLAVVILRLFSYCERQSCILHRQRRHQLSVEVDQKSTSTDVFYGGADCKRLAPWRLRPWSDFVLKNPDWGPEISSWDVLSWSVQLEEYVCQTLSCELVKVTFIFRLWSQTHSCVMRKLLL